MSNMKYSKAVIERTRTMLRAWIGTEELSGCQCGNTHGPHDESCPVYAAWLTAYEMAAADVQLDRTTEVRYVA